MFKIRKSVFKTAQYRFAFKKCLSGMERQNDVNPVQVMQLRRMMDFAMRSRYKTLKQTTMLHFFRNDE